MLRPILIKTAAVVCAVGLLLSAVSSSAAPKAKPSVETTRLVTYEDFFALAISIPQGEILPASKGEDIVIYFDTSASQTGQFRDDAFEALAGMLTGLTDNDRVRLFAIDLEPVPMTT